MVDYSLANDIYNKGIVTRETVTIRQYWRQVKFSYNPGYDGIDLTDPSDGTFLGFFLRKDVEEMNALLGIHSGLNSKTSDDQRNLEPSSCESGQDTASERQ
jgi:hypothetical protein